MKRLVPDDLARILSILFIVCYVCGFLFIWDFVDSHISVGHVWLTSSEDKPPHDLLFSRPGYSTSSSHPRGDL